MSVEKEDVWIQSYGGHKINPFQIDPTQVDIKDIAHALSMLCRYNGHIHTFYSVAQHSCHVGQMIYRDTKDTRLAYIGLLHDMQEAYIVDFCRPLKKAFQNYMELEAKVALEMYQVFGVEQAEYEVTASIVKKYDNIALVTEAIQLLNTPPINNWVQAYPVKAEEAPLVPLSPKEARSLFLQLFSQYKGY